MTLLAPAGRRGSVRTTIRGCGWRPSWDSWASSTSGTPPPGRRSTSAPTTRTSAGITSCGSRPWSISTSSSP